jgi:hypothetical protein
MTSLNVWIGFDPREMEAYQMATISMLKYNPTLNIRPVLREQLRQKELYWRDDPLASTEFSLTRFLVPKLSNYVGYSLFVDCDVIATVNLEKILDEADLSKAVNCVQHDYTPNSKIKMDGRTQHVYPRKNWSSVMLFNCNHKYVRRLTVDYVNRSSPSDLHRMVWAEDSIGELDPSWNCLSGYYDIDKPKIIHYTDGGPWLSKYQDCQYSEYYSEVAKEHKERFANFKA